MLIGARKCVQVNLETSIRGRSNIDDVEIMEAARETGLLDDPGVAPQALARLFLVSTAHAGHLAAGAQRARRREWLVYRLAVTSYISRVKWLSSLHLKRRSI